MNLKRAWGGKDWHTMQILTFHLLTIFKRKMDFLNDFSASLESFFGCVDLDS